MKPYASDLSDAEWAILEPLIPSAKPGGRPRSVNMRQILNGIFYVLRSGGAWRLLPPEYPAWSTVYDYIRRVAQCRRLGTNGAGTPGAPPCASGTPGDAECGHHGQSIDQNDRTGRSAWLGWRQKGERTQTAPTRGHDEFAATAVVVHSANLQDRQSVPLLLEPVKGQFPRMEKVWVDQGYTGIGKSWIEQHMQWTVEVVERSPRRGWIMTEDQGLVWVTLPKTFEALPRRWVEERTIAWIGRSRRMSKDYEYLTSSSEAMVYLTMLRLMLTRLAKQNQPQFITYKQKRAA